MITRPSQSELLRKYDVPTPRYTSFPTVPHWNTREFTVSHWEGSVKRAFDESNAEKGIALYLHLPFCESLCTYCACNTHITKNHTVERSYLDALLREWTYYCNLFGSKPIVRELHLGGGTPTFFSPANLHWLISTLLDSAIVHPEHQFSFEGHPNNTTREHLETLYKLGFTRVSFGVQDLDESVQKIINRVQPFENVKDAITNARAIGYTSVGIDLVYGLPGQTPYSVSDTLDHVLALRPDRVAFYSYAHVPELRPAQRHYSSLLPAQPLKRHFYEIGKHKLCKNGYADIGMDHFALTSDDLFKAHAQGKLHRNFMGYTTTATDLLIGLGATAISDSRYAYAQNVKTVAKYTDAIGDHGKAISKGHILSDEDMLRRECIAQLSCRGELDQLLVAKLASPDQTAMLLAMEDEGLLSITPNGVAITHTGHPFIRNICSVFDPYYRTASSQNVHFSKAI